MIGSGLPFAHVRHAVVVSLFLTTACGAPDDRPYFDAQRQSLEAKGLLKTDRAAPDVPVTPEILTNHFMRLAFGGEYTLVDGRYAALPANTGTALRRWPGPVRYRVSGRATSQDSLMVGDMASRLSRSTGLDIAPAPDGTTADLDIRILDRDTREIIVESFERTRLGELARAWASTPEWPCASEFYSRPAGDPDAHDIIFATVYIRDELSGIVRQACIEEEFAQVLGLARDDRSVRPSIFNDDDEYALLTYHDAILLGILYNPALEPGMTPDEALPVVRRIARDMLSPAAVAD